MNWNPEKDGISYKDLYIDVQTYRYNENKPISKNCINAWYFKHDNPEYIRGHKPTTILFFHGNSGNIGHRKYIVDICQRFNIDLLLVDYRGFGRSKGDLGHSTIYQDGVTAYKYLSSVVDPKQILIWGESLGGTVASYVASKYECRGLNMMATFSNLEDVLTSKKDFSDFSTKFLSKMMNLFTNPMSSVDYIEKVKCPIAIIHSTSYTYVTYDCANRLYKSINHKHKMLFTIDGDHSNPIISNEIFKSILAFMGIQGECQDEDIKYVTSKLTTICQDTEGLCDV